MQLEDENLYDQLISYLFSGWAVMHLSEPHLLQFQMAKPAVKCYFLVKVPMSWWVVIRATKPYNIHLCEFYYPTWQFRFVFKNHCTINCCALLKFKKSDLVFLMVRISIQRILQPLLG
jgi:hypothetical protein